MKNRRTIIFLVLLVCGAPTCAYAFWFELMLAMSGGHVFDAAKVAQMGQQYIVDSNKLNQLNATETTSRDQLVALQAMRTVYGDGNGVEAYIPSGAVNFSPEFQSSVDAYAKQLPTTPQGESMRTFLRRQNDREVQLQLYAERVKTTAAAQNRAGLSLTELAAIDNDLSSQAMDTRLEAITAAADANGVKALMRQRQLEIREYQLNRNRVDNSLEK